MKALDIYQIDAFTNECFRGNPAGLCILKEEIQEDCLCLIAREMNLSETAFVIPADGMTPADSHLFHLRWFTPKNEMPLCGHATLGAAKVLFDDIGINTKVIVFQTKSGCLYAQRHQKGITLDFPLDEPMTVDPPASLMKAMGIYDYENAFCGKNTNILIIHVRNEKEVAALKPNFEKMLAYSPGKVGGVGVTCEGKGQFDFKSRYFNPWVGVNEDPVTGSMHTLLAAYWGGLLDKKLMKAFQASSRGGEVTLELKEDGRVGLIGEAVIILKGSLLIPNTYLTGKPNSEKA